MERIVEVLKDVRDVPAWSMSSGETREAMVEITRLNAAMAELEARLVAHGRTAAVEAESGATSTANWWAHTTKQTRAGAHRKTKLAAALTRDLHGPVRDALADGGLLVDQAEMIIAAPGHRAPDLTRPGPPVGV